jgi:hypothetical protein
MRYRLALVTLALVVAACQPDQNPTAPATPPSLRNDKTSTVPVVVGVEVVPLLPNDILATINGIHVFNGGFGSAIDQPEGGNNDFYSLTDRGPNVAGNGTDKLFAVPDFHPQVGRFHLEGATLVRQGVIVLKNEFGVPMSGLPVGAAGCGATGEIPRDINGNLLPFDPNGIDSEGLRVLGDGSFWVSDEYGPFMIHFSRTGVTLEKDSPCSGPNPLPAVLTHRQANKGMEGLAALNGGHLLVGIVQNPLDNPAHADAKKSHLLRIVMNDVQHGKTAQYLYPMDDPSYGASDIEAVSNTTFLVDERDGNFLGDPANPAVQKKLYLIDISGATDISDPANGPNGLIVGGKTMEQMSDADLVANKIVPVKKTLVVDMLAYGYTHDKAEGVALIDGGKTIVVSNDDDFGVSDDGHAHLIQKLLPSGLVDHNEAWFFHLSKSLKSDH